MSDEKLILCVLSAVLVAASVSGSKLNVPRVLLPIFNDVSTKFILEAIEGGCYQWTTTRSDVIQLTLIDKNPDQECSAKALVSVITKEEARNIAVVLAEDVISGQMLKCDIVVDLIATLAVKTSTRELFMEEVPETFEIDAYDAQGNEFSTLEGVQFDWNIVALGPSGQDETPVVRYLPFRDSPYETPASVERLEEENRKGSIVLLEGIKTGSAKISVRLPYPEYRHVKTLEVVLTVIANLMLTPFEVYIMPGDVVSFKLFFIHSGKMNEITLPDIQYTLESEDRNIVKVEGNEATAIQIGKVRVLLKNKDMTDDPALKLPSATINVVKPAYILLTVMPHKNWAILIGDQHEIFAEVFSSTDHKLYLGASTEIHTLVGDGFHVEERSKNGSWLSGWGLKESKTIVHASMEAAVHPRLGKFMLEDPIISQGELYIYPRITVSPPEVILPWDSHLKPRYDIELVAKGGDGRFLWSSSDHTVGMVTQAGRLRTLTAGSFDVTAAMMRNHHNRQIVKVSILPPVRLEIVEFVMESEIFTPIFIHIALYAEKRSHTNQTKTFIPFTQCQNIPFQVRQTDNKFIYNKTAVIPPVGVSCGNVAMVGTMVGTTKVTITYYYEEEVLEDSVTITAYSPLELIYPGPDENIVLAVGSSINLIFSGGPRPQIGRQSDHQRIVISENEAIVQAEDVTDSHKLPGDDDSVVWVLCRKLGETHVKLMISNAPPVPTCKSLASTYLVKIICGKPRRIHVRPEVRVPNAKACPMDLSSDRVVVPKYQNISLDVFVQDELGRVFLNSSSLNINWVAKPKASAKFEAVDGTLTRSEFYGTVPIANKTQQVIILSDPNAELIEISGTVVGYRSPVLKVFQITPEWPEFLSGDEKVNDLPVISAQIGLFLVEGTVVNPNYTIIFNQPSMRKIISVLKGSGHIELQLSADNIARVTYSETTREIEIIPMAEGEMTIKVVDLCLLIDPIFITVKVVTLGKIEVESPDKVEINHCVPVVVKLFDENEEILDVNDVTSIDLRPRFTKNIANLGRMPMSEDEPWTMGHLHFVLTGLELGTTQLTFSFDNNYKEVVSAPVEIQVFPPLRVSPRNATLIIGATLQLTLKGGPQPDSNLEFLSHHISLVDVSILGIITGNDLGSTRITARSIGVHPVTGDKVVYTEDTIDVHVIKMTGVKISSPLTKFRVGGTVPCWVTGIPEQLSPLILASYEDNSVATEWYFDEEAIATINPVFGSVGVIYKNQERIAIRITGLQPGVTRLGVNVTVATGKTVEDKSKQTVVFQASLDIEIFETFSLVLPKRLAGKPLMMAQFAQIQMESNLDDTEKIEYFISDTTLQGTEAVPINATSAGSRSIVTVTKKGMVQSYGAIGYAVLLMVATDENGLKQTLSFVVEVKPVHYLMLTVVANWRIHLDSALRVIPLGTEFDLVPQFYDNTGKRFNAGPKSVKVRSNRLDLVRIKQLPGNTTIQVISKRPGHTVIKAWTDGPDNTADYVRVHSEEVLKTVVEFLTSGDIMCLWSPVVTKHLQAGHWTTSDETLITIDESIDIAFVIGHKEGTVLLTHPLHAHAPLRLRVLPVAEVALFPGRTRPYLTNGVAGHVQRIGVVLKSVRGPEEKRSNLIQGWLCDRSFARYYVPLPFKCYVAFTNESVGIDANVIFTLSSGFKPEIGQYYCKILSTGVNASEISVALTNITVTVIAEEGDIEAKPLDLFFTPSPYVEPELLLGDTGNVAVLDIKGLEYVLQRLDVHPVDSSILYVDKGYIVEPEKEHKKYQVMLIDYHPKFADNFENMGILITSTATDQVIKVMVKVSSNYQDDTCFGKSPLLRFLQRYKHVIIIALSMILIFFLTCYIYSRYMQPVVQVNVNPNRSLLAMGTIGSSTGSNLACYPPAPGPVATSSPLNLNHNLNRTVPLMSPRMSMSMSPTAATCADAMTCSCMGRHGGPVYGDPTSYGCCTPEVRRNRRFL